MPSGGDWIKKIVVILTFAEFTDNRATSENLTQQTRNIDPMLLLCWLNVCDAGPTLHQHWSTSPDCRGITQLIISSR